MFYIMYKVFDPSLYVPETSTMKKKKSLFYLSFNTWQSTHNHTGQQKTVDLKWNVLFKFTSLNKKCPNTTQPEIIFNRGTAVSNANDLPAFKRYHFMTGVGLFEIQTLICNCRVYRRIRQDCMVLCVKNEWVHFAYTLIRNNSSHAWKYTPLAKGLIFPEVTNEQKIALFFMTIMGAFMRKKVKCQWECKSY